MKRTKVMMKDGQEVEALTLTGLYERLGQIIQERKDKSGYAERNDNPVVIMIPQGRTLKGKRRRPHYFPITSVESANVGLVGLAGDYHLHHGFNVVEAGDMILTASRVKRRG